MEPAVSAVAAIAIIVSLVSLGVTLALARQLGLILIRLGPDRPQLTAAGLDLGTTVEPHHVVDVTGVGQVLPAQAEMMRSLLVFTSPSCPACQELKPGLAAFAKAYRAEIQVYVISLAEYTRAVDLDDLVEAGAIVTVNPDLHRDMNVHGVPFSMLLDEDNAVLTRGTTNSLAQLESLISIETLTAEDATTQSRPLAARAEGQ